MDYILWHSTMICVIRGFHFQLRKTHPLSVNFRSDCLRFYVNLCLPFIRQIIFNRIKYVLSTEGSWTVFAFSLFFSLNIFFVCIHIIAQRSMLSLFYFFFHSKVPRYDLFQLGVNYIRHSVELKFIAFLVRSVILNNAFNGKLSNDVIN